jgi:AcrR family transcriptional regulator
MSLILDRPVLSGQEGAFLDTEDEMATSTAIAKPARDKEASSSARKHRAILDAALKVFLRSGYLGANMDEIAALSEVSKQTIYKHCSSKEACVRGDRSKHD